MGPSHKLSGSEPHLLTIEAGLGAIREVRLPGKVDTTFGTGRVGVNYRYVISKAADFQNQTNLILNLSNRDDWRLTNMAAVTALLKSHFSLKFAYTFAHLNTPPSGKKKTDSMIAAALVAKF